MSRPPTGREGSSSSRTAWRFLYVPVAFLNQSPPTPRGPEQTNLVPQSSSPGCGSQEKLVLFLIVSVFPAVLSLCGLAVPGRADGAQAAPGPLQRSVDLVCP